MHADAQHHNDAKKKQLSNRDIFPGRYNKHSHN
jgi:hypothetical protein